MNGINFTKLLDDRVKQFPKQIITKNKKDEFTIINNINNTEIRSQEDLKMKDEFKIKIEECMKRMEEIKKNIII